MNFMLRRLVLACLLGAGAAAAQTTVPASEVPSSSNAEIDSILDRLETKGRAIQGLSTNVEYHDIRVDPVSERITKNGELLFRRLEPNSKFLIVFRETIAGGVKNASSEYFLFDGEWLTERNDRTRTVIRRQIVRPGERIDPFRIGRGPFPLPFGQRRAEMLENFHIAIQPPQSGDPPNTDHLRCIPRPKSELARQYTRVDLYIDRRVELPVRIEVERLADENIIDVRFANLNPNEAPAESRFQIDRPAGGDWEIREEPLPPAPVAGDAGGP